MNPSSGSGGLGNGTTNTSGGKLKQDAEKSMARSGPGVGGDVLGHLSGPSGSTGRSMESEAGPGSTGIDETYDVSGRNAATVTTGMVDAHFP
ncbi:MAG: hypothetical protein KF789_08785 [Bdellovibrionaceae bacterium]|nr:hypothetical protein [Pseudobdellovibrionaceae bacterium]